MQRVDLSKLWKFIAPEYVFGAGASRLVGQFAKNYSLRKVLLVTGPNVIRLPWANAVVQNLMDEDIAHTIFNDISPNPRDHQVMKCAEVYRSEECDGIIAMGGGSPMDLAKAAGAVCTNDTNVLTFEGVDNVHRPGPPLICIPTTAGTAADISQFSIINDTGRRVKMAIVSKTMVPDVALIDPETTFTMNAELTANTGIDALTHAFEAFTSNASSPSTDLHALEAVRLIRMHLRNAVADAGDLEARTGMMLASTYAGLAFSNAILGAVHAMAHSLGGLLDLPHGLCNAILLDHVVDFNFDAAPEKYALLGKALGAPIADTDSDETAKARLIESIRELKQDVGVGSRLRALGMTDDVLPALAQNALNDPCMLTNPKTMSFEDVTRLYEQAQ